jgi:hypothetical protein
MRRAIICAAVALSASSARAATHDIGFNVHQSLDTGVPVSAACGGSIVRIDLNWIQIEETEGNFNWALFDALIDGARARGQRVLAVPAYGPAWASAQNLDGKGSTNDVPRPGLYELFVRAAVERYRDRVEYWELWNEPNLEEFFEGTPQQYVDVILKPGASAVKSVCPECRTLAPGIATLVAGKYDVWMKTVLEQAKDQIDIVSGHVYSDFPSDPTNPTAITFFTKLEAHRVLTHEGAILYEDPLSLRESQVKYGAGNKPFWLTETGKTAKFGDTAAMAEQSVYARKVLEAMLTRPWWQTTIFYEAFDEPTMSYDWGFALRDPDAPEGYRAKPVCALVSRAVARQPLFGGTGTDCDDGLDNEGDGRIDYPADDDCSSTSTRSEGAPPVMDAGGEDDAGEDSALSSDAPSSEGGCGCRAARSTSPWSWSWLLALPLLRRRRAD